MTTYTLTKTPTTVAPLYPHGHVVAQSPVRTVSAVFDGAKATLFKGSAIATADIFELLPIPAGSFVLTVTHQVTTAEGGTCTFDIGDGTDDNGWVVAATNGNGNSTSTNSNSFNGTTTPAFGVGKYYSAADTIDLTLVSGTAALVIVKISATYIEVTPVAC